MPNASRYVDGEIDIVKALLPYMTDDEVDAKDRSERTVLHYAAFNCWWETIELLLPRSDVTAQDNEGMTALQVGIAYGLLNPRVGPQSALFKSVSTLINGMQRPRGKDCSPLGVLGHQVRRAARRLRRTNSICDS
jgi:ankyrin repeat protein